MSVLLDTNVLSEIWRPQGDARVKQRVAAEGADATFLSVITIGEVARGIALLPPGNRRAVLAGYLASIEAGFQDRILAVTRAVAQRWGEISASRRLLGRPLAPADGLIAATAFHHGLAVMTRNGRDYADTGVTVIDPWTD